MHFEFDLQGHCYINTARLGTVCRFVCINYKYLVKKGQFICLEKKIAFCISTQCHFYIHSFARPFPLEKRSLSETVVSMAHCIPTRHFTVLIRYQK